MVDLEWWWGGGVVLVVSNPPHHLESPKFTKEAGPPNLLKKRNAICLYVWYQEKEPEAHFLNSKLKKFNIICQNI